MGRRSWFAIVPVLLLGACVGDAGPEPSPSPSPTAPVAGSTVPPEPVGFRVAVVAPLAGEAPVTTAGTVQAAEDVAGDHRGDVGEFRIVAPDGASFVRDVVTLLAEQGYDLVCVVGDTAVDVTRRVAPTFPATSFCAVPGPMVRPATELPANLLVVDLRVGETAYLGGIAAAALPVPPVRPSPAATPSPAAGFVGDATRPTTARQRAAFEAGLEAVLGSTARALVSVSATTADGIAGQARQQFRAGAPVVYTASGAGDEAVLEAARDESGLVVLHRDRARFGTDGTPPQVLSWFLVDVGVALDLAVTQLVDGWTGGLATVGLAEGALRPQPGGAPAAEAVGDRVADAAAALVEGRTTVPAG